MKGLGVVGLGKLGAPLAAVFAAAGVRVMAFDLDERKARAVASAIPPVAEPELADFLKRGQLYLASAQHWREVARETEACIFVVPTPSLPDGDFDHSHLKVAMTALAQEVETLAIKNYVFIVASTVMPGFMCGEAKPLLQSIIKDRPFRLAYKPELIALGSVIRDLRYPDVQLIGADDRATWDYVFKLYQQITIGPVAAERLTLTECELAKISINCALTMKISFANQVGELARRMHADGNAVLRAVGADRRIGPKCLKPGLPFGGPCLPRDNRMFMQTAKREGMEAPLSAAADLINRYTVDWILRQLPRSGEVGILGMAYKPGTCITEESAGERLKAALLARGQAVKTHDPVAPCDNNLKDTMACPYVVIACEWPEYAKLPFRWGQVVLSFGGNNVAVAEQMEAVAR